MIRSGNNQSDTTHDTVEQSLLDLMEKIVHLYKAETIMGEEATSPNASNGDIEYSSYYAQPDGRLHQSLEMTIHFFGKANNLVHQRLYPVYLLTRVDKIQIGTSYMLLSRLASIIYVASASLQTEKHVHYEFFCRGYSNLMSLQVAKMNRWKKDFQEIIQGDTPRRIAEQGISIPTLSKFLHLRSNFKLGVECATDVSWRKLNQSENVFLYCGLMTHAARDSVAVLSLLELSKIISPVSINYTTEQSANRTRLLVEATKVLCLKGRWTLNDNSREDELRSRFFNGCVGDLLAFVLIRLSQCFILQEARIASSGPVVGDTMDTAVWRLVTEAMRFVRVLLRVSP